MITWTRSPPGSYHDHDPCSRAPTWSSMQGSHITKGDPRQLARPSSPRWCPSSFSSPRRWMTNWLMRSSRSGGYKYPERHLGQRGPTGPWNGLGRPGPISAQSVASFARRWFLSLLDPSPFCMWALVVSFSLSWTKLLAPQDSTLSWVGPWSLSSSRVWSMGFLESCLLHCLTCTGLQGLVMRCLVNLSRKSCFQR
jgi:hypothetical protein